MTLNAHWLISVKQQQSRQLPEMERYRNAIIFSFWQCQVSCLPIKDSKNQWCIAKNQGGYTPNETLKASRTKPPKEAWWEWGGGAPLPSRKCFSVHFELEKTPSAG